MSKRFGFRFIHVSSLNREPRTMDQQIEARERKAARRDERKRRDDDLPPVAEQLDVGFAMLAAEGT